jgi:hypothetical protein
MDRNELCIGDIVRHFKYETLSENEKMMNKYTYRILGTAVHSETKELMIIYSGLYYPFETYVRPLDMFMSEVDHEKYPDIKQKYRFEKVI